MSARPTPHGVFVTVGPAVDHPLSIGDACDLALALLTAVNEARAMRATTTREDPKP